MFGENKNKLIKIVGEHSSIGSDFTFEGLVNSPGEIELSGSIKGPVNVKALYIKEKGTVIGEINAESVEVHGYVDGTIVAQRVIIGSTGEFKGDISFTDILKVEDGASLSGMVKKVPLVKIENRVTNFLNTTKEIKKNLIK